MKTTGMLSPEVQNRAILDAEKNRDDVLKTFALFTTGNFNRRPKNGGWSAAHIARHFNLSEDGMAEMFRKPVEHTDREPDALVPAVKGIFLDFDARYNAPDFSFPDDTIRNMGEETALLKANRNEVISTAGDMDLSLLCMGFNFPGLGFLTRYEWLYFNIYHTQRHIRQLENILREWDGE